LPRPVTGRRLQHQRTPAERRFARVRSDFCAPLFTPIFVLRPAILLIRSRARERGHPCELGSARFQRAAFGIVPDASAPAGFMFDKMPNNAASYSDQRFLRKRVHRFTTPAILNREQSPWLEI